MSHDNRYLQFVRKIISLRTFFFTRTVSILLLLFLFYGARNFPKEIESTDFVTVTYIAGCMAKDGKSSQLYLNESQSDLDNSSFNKCAHKRLKGMSAAGTTTFLYPPLVAFLAQPFSYLKTQDAFLVWQTFSILALLLSAIFISLVTTKKWESYFFSSILFFPVFQVLFEGQTDLIMIVLPLSLGYCLVKKGHPAMAGFVWSILSLKPQFIPVILLFIGSYALARKWKPALGFAIGIGFACAGNIFCFGIQTFLAWLAILKNHMILADNVFPTARYLISSLPMALLERLPQDLKAISHSVVYVLVIIIFAHAIFISLRLIKPAGENYVNCASLVFILGIFLLPIISRYLLFYDLSIFALAAMLIFGDPVLNSNKSLLRDTVIAWCLIDLYTIGFIFVKPSFIQPPVLIVILLWIYIRTLNILPVAGGEFSSGKMAIESRPESG